MKLAPKPKSNAVRDIFNMYVDTALIIGVFGIGVAALSRLPFWTNLAAYAVITIVATVLKLRRAK